MKKKTKWTLVVLLALIGGGCYLMLNTRMGVYIASDVIGEFGEVELQTAAEDGPLVLTENIFPVREITLPREIEQASGIRINEKRIYLCTDQTELFELDHNWKLKTEPITLVDGLLYFKQGAMEGIGLDKDRLFAIGEFGVIKSWTRMETTWVRADDIALPKGYADREYSSMVVTEKGRYACMEDDLILVDVDTGELREIELTSVVKPKRKAEEMSFSGVAAAAGRLVLLSEDFTSLVIIDESSLAVQAVLGIEPCAAADIEIVGTEAFIVVDHNYLDERPPVKVYDLSRYLN